jgi:hypothetical protein
MVKYNSERQLTIEEFKTPFQTSLLADNRWVKLSKVVPWDKFASAYMSMMTIDFGRPGVSPRTYRRKMDKAYLDYSKKKKKREATHRKMTRKLLECVNRDIKQINNMLDVFESKGKLIYEYNNLIVNRALNYLHKKSGI